MRSYADTAIRIPMYPVIPTCDVCKITPRFTLDYFDGISEIHVDMCADEGRWTWWCVRCQAESPDGDVVVVRLSEVLRENALLDLLGGLPRLIEIEMTELLIAEADALMAAETHSAAEVDAGWNVGDMGSVLGEAKAADYWRRSHSSATARLAFAESLLPAGGGREQMRSILCLMRIGALS